MKAPADRALRPRFARSAPQPMRLTSDDVVILRHVAEHRFLRSTHLMQLIERSSDRVLHRLAALFHNGYLDRPRSQREVFARDGNVPLVYALGERGAAALIETGTDIATSWSDKNRSATKPYLEHALLIADLMVALERAVRHRSDVSLLSAREIFAHAPQAAHRAALWKMTTTVAGHAIDVVPDKVFALHFVDRDHTNYFLVEADRATMPISRSSLAQVSIRKKLLAYHHGHAAKRHTTLWNIPGFRVLSVTTSKERMQSMIEVVNEITAGKGSNVFLFADAATLARHDPLTMEWISGKALPVRLTD